jgi:GGDEF domain-containing protein
MQPASAEPIPQASEPIRKAEEQPALEDVLLALLHGVQEHFLAADQAGDPAFRAEFATLEDRFKTGGSASELVSSAIAVMDRHAALAKKAMAQHKTALTRTASGLTSLNQAVEALQADADRWTRLEEQVKGIAPGDDLEIVKAKLCANAAVARAESLQEQRKLGALLSDVLTKLDTPAGAASEPVESEAFGPRADQLTGLPGRPHAEAELIRVHGEPADCFLALFVVKRLALINSRFGYARGDEVLLKVVMHLLQMLPNFKMLYRWAPCAFLTLPPPNTAYKELRSKVQAVELARLTPTLEWEGRSAMVPIAMDCRIVSVKDFPTASELFLRLDTLASDT